MMTARSGYFGSSTTKTDVDAVCAEFDRHVPAWRAAVDAFETTPSDAKKRRVKKLNNTMFVALRPLARYRLAFRNRFDTCVAAAVVSSVPSLRRLIDVKFWRDAHAYVVRQLDRRLEMLARTDYMY